MNLKLGNKNSRRFLNLIAGGLLLTMVILLGFTQPVVAADPAFEFTLPAGYACGDFDLNIKGYGEEPQAYEMFVDKNGNVREITAGTGYTLVYTNLSTDATFSTKSNGAVSQKTTHPDGSYTLTLLGHNLVILFPTDVPAGPSTTLHVGRVVFTVDTSGNWTRQKVAGQQIDICAALSE